MWQRTSCKADEEEIEFGKGVIICDKMPPFSYISPINSGEDAISHMVLLLHKEARMKEGKHTLYLSFFLHGQNFWRIKFTRQFSANFPR